MLRSGPRLLRPEALPGVALVFILFSPFAPFTLYTSLCTLCRVEVQGPVQVMSEPLPFEVLSKVLRPLQEPSQSHLEVPNTFRVHKDAKAGANGVRGVHAVLSFSPFALAFAPFLPLLQPSHHSIRECRSKQNYNPTYIYRMANAICSSPPPLHICPPSHRPLHTCISFCTLCRIKVSPPSPHSTINP